MITVDSYLLLVTIWICWCGLHSLLICVPVTSRLEGLLGSNFRFYRLTYNLISIVTLAVPVYYSLSLPAHEMVAFAWPEGLTTVRFLLVGLAVFLFVSGARQYNMSYFLGISQIRTGLSRLLLKEHNDFTVSGASTVLRHPWYLGGIILSWSAPHIFYPSTVITALVVSTYFLVGALLEERKLVGCFGDSYRDYQRQVSMLFPAKWLNALIFNTKKRGK